LTEVPMIMGKSYVDIFELDQDVGDRKLLASLPVDHAPYLHSFGVTGDFAIVPLQPIQVSLAKMMTGSMMNRAFEEITNGKYAKASEICVVALNPAAKKRIGNKDHYCVLTDRWFYMHTVNAYENASGVIIDICNTVGYALTSPAITIPVMRNHTARNEQTLEDRGGLTRYYIPFPSDETRNEPEYHKEALGIVGRTTDMPTIHPMFQGVPYCIYYALEYWHNDKDFAAIAVVRHDTCTGDRKYFYRENLHPSEPGMIPAGLAEAPGLLTFPALDGIEGVSYLYILDAETMEIKSRVKIPERITFTVHHNWFDAAGVVPLSAPVEVPTFV